MRYEDFINKDGWLGSFYEITIHLSEKPDNARLRKALELIVGHSSVKGLWWNREEHGRPSVTAARIPLDDLTPEDGISTLYGEMEISGISYGFQLNVIRMYDGSGDHLDISIPVAMLKNSLPGFQYPIDLATNPRLADIDAGLLAIADAINAEVPFDLAALGEEVSGFFEIDRLHVEDVEAGGAVLSSKLWNELKPGKEWKDLKSGLKFRAFVGPWRNYDTIAS
jgi:hypothetical protein